MFTRQYVKKKRCNECKRRKKKCELSGESCLYCLQKGIKCLFPNEILDFDPQKGKINKKETYAQRIVKLDHKCKHHNLIIQPKIQRQLHFPNENKFFFMGYLNPKLFVPIYDSIIKANETPMINDDKISIRVFNKDMEIDDKFALSSYALSSIRIKYIEDNTNFETDRIIIERLANSTLKDGLCEFFQMNNITISQSSNTNEELNSLITKTNIKSIDDINLKVDFENLKNILMIEEPAITTDSNNKKFINLPYFITADMANSLFNYFCNICTKEFPLSSPNSKISMLTVTLPLILGNLTILKVVLLCSYFHKLQNENNDAEFIKILPQMKQLHLDILIELSRRLEYYSSVSCDHSIFCVFILLTIEIINGGRGKLWKSLQNLAQSMISLRGGVEELCQSLTGECIIKLLLSILCTEVDSEYISFGINDLKYICEFNEKHEFFDNLVNMNSLILKDFKIVIQMYFQVSVLISLINPSLGLDKKEKINNGELPKISYELISEANMERIMHEAFILEMNIKCFDVNKIPNSSFINSQINFARESCLLYIYQLIYKQSSLSPNTLLLIKSLKKKVETILTKLKAISESELRQTSVLILPIFCYGVDLVGDENRKKFIEDLKDINKISGKQMINSAIDLLNVIWAYNNNGLCFVDWKVISAKYKINISLCC